MTEERDSRSRPRVVIVDRRGVAFSEPVLDLLDDAGCDVVTSEAADEDGVIAAARDADGLIYTGVTTVRLIEALSRCKVIARSSIGMDDVDGVELATKKGIVLCNMPGVIEEEVADHTIGLLLAVARRIVVLDRYVRDGGWQRGVRRGYGELPRLHGATIGLVGFGRIARAVARRARGFAMRVLAFDPFIDASEFRANEASGVTLAEVLQDSDVVSLHVPLTPSTRHLIGARELAMMRREAILLNTARGPVIDEEALLAALRAGRIGGAGLDVAEEEPIEASHPLCQLDNVVLTPHCASRSVVTERERHIRPAQEVVAVLAGLRPRAVWNSAVLDHLELR
jgi:D-3-phosphoglycerate dehydrogenase